MNIGVFQIRNLAETLSIFTYCYQLAQKYLAFCKVLTEYMDSFSPTTRQMPSILLVSLPRIYQKAECSRFISTFSVSSQLNKTLINSFSLGMKKSCLIIMIILLLLPSTLSQDCTTALSSDCGASGSTCQYFKWTNGSCMAPSGCPTTPVVTVWSNSSYNCIACSQADKDHCALCLTYNYYFNSDKSLCTACSTTYGSLCATCNTTECLTCTDPATYILTADKKSCGKVSCDVQYCIDCLSNNSTYCKTCDDSHTLYKGTCTCSIANCKVCSAGLCSKCQDGYSLDTSGTKCNFICISNCDVCSDLNSCTTCALGYKYDSSVNQCKLDCTAINANCISCTSRTKCTSCSSAYNVNRAGTACDLKCTDSNCATCSPTNNCTECGTGYFKLLNNATNLYYCSSDICQISYCSSCASTTTCKSCISLYKLNNATTACIPDCGIDNCASCSSTSACQTCIDGYKVQSNKCVPICSISNCLLCASQSSCLKCSDGFLLASSGQSCNYNCRIEGCITCSGLNTCSLCNDGTKLNGGKTACVVQCTDGFYLEGTKCKTCPTPNCLTCDSTGKCSSCVGLYYLDSAKDFVCTKCSSIANCYDCEASQAVCKTCISGFSVINSICVDNSKCTVSDCKVCMVNSTVTCQTCQDGFSVNANNTCSAIVCTGGQYLVGYTCTCGPKSYMVNSVCVACSDSNCMACTSTACTSCISGYYPSGTSCVKCSSNCLTCDSTGCSNCKDNFVIVTGACQPPTSNKVTSIANTGDPINCPTGCKTCDLDASGNTVCRAALDGYVLVAGKIYKCASSCLTCSPQLNAVTNQYSYCLTCPTGTNFNAGSCSRCTDKNALTCRTNNAGYSLTCKPGYNPESGSCKACDANCLKCGTNKAGSCDVGGCVTGYYQSKDSVTCVKCFGGCLVCDTDPNVCLKCGDYKYLSKNACLNCGTNCVTCTSSSSCTFCEVGYLPATDGSCKSLNIDNCVAYDASLACSKCDSSYTLANNKLSCTLTQDCNGTCTSCKSGYYLTNGTCLTCPALTNCNYCDQYDSPKCGSCLAGYYSNSGVCTKCPQTGCATCLSEYLCTSANSGYYLVVDISGALTGDVMPCGGQCGTCILSELTCLTCTTGASQTGTSCLKDNNIVLTIVASLINLMSGASSQFQLGQGLSKYPKFLQELGVKALGFPTFYDFQANSRVNKVSSGSVVTEVAINADKITGDANQIVSTATFTEFSIVSHSIVTNSSSSSSSVNLGLVLGVAIPLGVLLIAIIIILKVKSDKVDEETGLDGTEKDIEYKVEQF